MEHPAETLTHDRVELRRKRLDDADEQHRVVVESLEHLLPWMAWASGYTRESLEDHLIRAQKDWASGTAYDYVIVSDGVPVGSCSLMRRIGPGGFEIGYWIHPGWTGRGLVTMAVAALVEAAFALPATTHVEIHHDEANTASGAVPGRLGFTVVSREPDAERGGAPAESGVTVVHRLNRG
ncbi:GNAT family N-acetyltransferase [Streptacidiphilus carbonis]|jgi:ribosomal-protein-serine acetyltransferase|uniref:GNAT family N-acetyltransferase n=1 Tax=Streptacidiphilus carbonis TaxID=105422 RepID=UPI0005AAB215|nr:GNAT family N-acetyltransferase [Streptacidiphilus carbonis]